MPTVTSTSLDQTAKVAKEWLSYLKRLPTLSQARIIAMRGDLGSGKTTFIQAAAKELGITERVVSPTFVIEKVYHLPVTADFKYLIHLDCYRLESASELEHLGWTELITKERNLIMVEWPEKIKDILPADYLKLDFKFIDEQTREINY